MKLIHNNYLHRTHTQVARIARILESKGFKEVEVWNPGDFCYRNNKFSVMFSTEHISVYKKMSDQPELDRYNKPISFPEETLEWFSFDAPISLKRAIAGSLICDGFEVKYAGAIGEFRTSGEFFQVYRSGKYCEWLPISSHQVVVTETGSGDAIWNISSIAQYRGPILGAVVTYQPCNTVAGFGLGVYDCGVKDE